MVLNQNRKDIISEVLLAVEKSLRDNKDVFKMAENKVVELYLNDSKLKKEVENPKDVISEYIVKLDEFLNIYIHDDTVESFDKNINVKELVYVRVNPSEIIEIEFTLRLFNKKINAYETNELICYIYDREKEKKEVLEYIDRKGLNEEQKSYILDEFEENFPASKNLESITENLKESLLDSFCKLDLKELINNSKLEIKDVIEKDLSLDILNLIRKDSEILKIFKDVISVEKVSNGYNLLFCGDIVQEITYSIELSF